VAALPSGELEELGVSDAAAEPAAPDAAEAPQQEAVVVSGAAEVPQPVAVWAGAAQRPAARDVAEAAPQEAVRIGAVVRQQEARDAAVRLRAAPDARAAALPLAAPLAFRRDRFPAPAP
jgi:hypothetical protein